MNKNKSFLFIAIIVAIILILSVSYALFSQTLFGQKNYILTSGDLKIYLSEETAEDISLIDVKPVTDEVGKMNPEYQFSLVNEEREDIEYTIYLKEEEFENKTPTSAIRYHYTRDIGNVKITRNMEESKTEDGRFYLESGVVPANTIYEYTFKMWINIHAGNEIMGTQYSLKIQIEAIQTVMPVYKELVLNGCDPVLSNNLVPVIIEDDGTVKKADLKQEWYRYSNQRWANAIVLEDNTIEYTENQVIPDGNIESYFVWIPKYRYQLWDLGNYNGLTSFDNTKVHTIGIQFGLEDTNDAVEGECTSPKTSGGSGNCKVGDYMTHPAFQAFDLNGFWIAKFESGYKNAFDVDSAQVNSVEHSKLIIKPNVYSWRGISLANSFVVSYNYLREEESHMMKNTEWGAVSYLQHSDYGSGTNVRVNNNRSFLTGYAAVKEPTLGYNGGVSIDGNVVGTTPDVTQAYNTEIGYMASTTGNISGVYDMSGGAWEYVMGYNTKASTVGGNSGLTDMYGNFFTSKEWEKYYDRYSNSTTSNIVYNIRILGDATGEVGPFGNLVDPDGATRNRNSWYKTQSYVINPSRPWFTRGGGWDYGRGAGPFAFSISDGKDPYTSFRVVLTPKGYS